jgi:hypothetical protein
MIEIVMCRDSDNVNAFLIDSWTMGGMALTFEWQTQGKVLRI